MVSMVLRKNPAAPIGLLLLVLLPFLVFFVTRPGSQTFYNPSSFAKSSEVSTFRNDMYGYTFSHNATYTVEEVSDHKIVSLHKENNDEFITISVEPDLGIYAGDVRDFLVKRLTHMQEALWKENDGRVMKTKVKDYTAHEFKNPHGIIGYEIYLIIETTDDKGSVYEKGRIGPFIGFPLSSQNEYIAVIAHGYGDSSSERLHALYTIADSFRLH